MSSQEKLVYQPEYTNSWALIIGINQYKFAPPLGYAKSDAEAVADILEKKFQFPKSNISLLIDKDATKDTINKSFLDFKKTLPDDRLIVFYAGHGHTVSGKRGEVGYLVPAEGKPDEIDTLIRWDEFTRNSDLIPAKHIFFLMDACYGGLAFLRTPSLGSMRFIGDMLKRYSRQLLTAGKANETVADGNGTRPDHSIFTSHLLDALDGAASTKDGIISASGVMAYVFDHVANDQYSHQTPHYGFVDGDGEFIFDTSVLEQKKNSSPQPESSEKGEPGEVDILVNTSPQIETPFEPKTPIADTIKELLSVPSNKIKLDDFVSKHIRHFLDETDLRNFPVQGIPAQKDQFIQRLSEYEELSKDLQVISILLAKWGNSEQLQQLNKIFTRLAEADKGSSGTVLWLRFTWYPIQLLMYSAGITALSSQNYGALKIIFETPVRPEPLSDQSEALVTPVGANLSEIHESFKWIPGRERHYAPRSEQLFTTLQPTLEDLLFLGRNYEYLFDYFEILFALEYSHVNQSGWGPPGRFAWKYQRRFGENPFKMMLDEADKSKDHWGPISAGLFNKSFTEFQKNSTAYEEHMKRLAWW
ncbi:MAG: caspase family protein [Patescibacteria group bacterium]|jgi:hypothetical protein